MMRYLSNSRTTVIFYFAVLITLGTVLLALPVSWTGSGPLPLVDALFTATSAVAVTGLTTVDTAQFSWFGKIVIMLLIQFGGLGVVTAILISLARADAPVSVHSRKLLKDYFLPTVENRPGRIIMKVLLYALCIELIGALILWPFFAYHGVSNSFFHALFHAVSAFCNAGFSTFSNNLESFAGTQHVTLVISLLVILGGLGFVVHDDVRHRISGRTKRLKAHSWLMLVSTLIALTLGTLVYALLEWNNALAVLGDQPFAKVYESFVMAVQPRTAGFDAISPASTSPASQFFTMLLMITGGGPSSTAGGLKLTTVVILLLAVFRGSEADGDLKAGRRRIDGRIVGRASFLAVRMALLLALMLFLLIISEIVIAGHSVSVLALAFETISAFCTVGLSMNVTASLSPLGKIIIVATMYIGRIGLLVLAIQQSKYQQQKTYSLPKEEVMIG
jgi:trk system potassium uptake protein TrkH